MALANDLLAQAKILANLDLRRPKQANLRRAVSACYYALFHLLLEEASQSLAGANVPGLADRVSRAFSHNDMRRACSSVISLPLPPSFAVLIAAPVTARLRTVAERFITLQDLRHSADYDVAATFSRADVLALVENTESAFQGWREIRASKEATVFLAALAFGARWSK